MSVAVPFPPPTEKSLPTHLDLPDTDGLPVPSFAEFPQSNLLSTSIRPPLDRIHPDGMYIVGQDNGIYYRITDPPLKGCKSPDWYYIPGANPTPTDFPYRRSHVLWQEKIKPTVLIEYVSDDTGREWDRTPEEGKFWVYENIFEAHYYAIHTHETGVLEVYKRIRGKLQRMKPNSHGRYPISTFGLELGTKHEKVGPFELDWLRWFDADGILLPSAEEQIDLERLKLERAMRRAATANQRATSAEQLATAAEQRATSAEEQARKLANKLRELGIDPEKL